MAAVCCYAAWQRHRSPARVTRVRQQRAHTAMSRSIKMRERIYSIHYGWLPGTEASVSRNNVDRPLKGPPCVIPFVLSSGCFLQASVRDKEPLHIHRSVRGLRYLNSNPHHRLAAGLGAPRRPVASLRMRTGHFQTVGSRHSTMGLVSGRYSFGAVHRSDLQPATRAYNPTIGRSALD